MVFFAILSSRRNPSNLSIIIFLSGLDPIKYDWCNSYYEKFDDGTIRCIDDEIPFEIPESWCWVKLGNLIDFSSNSSVSASVIPQAAWILNLEDIEKDSGKLLCKKRKSQTSIKSDKHTFKCGNVLYSKLRPYLNKVIIADEDGYCTSEILAFDFGEILNRFAQLYLMSPFFVEYAMSDAYGVKMPRLGSRQGNEAFMPIPPIQEQRRIVKQMDILDPFIQRYAENEVLLARLNDNLTPDLRKSILQEAIQGRLVLQNPDDEPVSVLLQRIKAEKERLIKEKKIKRDKAESIIFRGDDNFVLSEVIMGMKHPPYI